MRSIALALVACLVVGCAPLFMGGVAVTGVGLVAFHAHGALPANGATSNSAEPEPSNQSIMPTTSAPSAPSSAPQIVIPATGGAPVVGIPIGGNLYIPATGGPPITGIPTS